MTMTNGNPVHDSALYQGFVRHRRFTPKKHEFRYPLFMAFIKLSELSLLADRLFLFGTRTWHWARFRRADYLGDPETPLAESVKRKIGEITGIRKQELNGEIYFYGHLRYLGFYFSPLNLYFVEQRGKLRYMLAEVSNTPWNERHYYVVDLDKIEPHAKQFHVSPFNPMSQTYGWKVRPPGAASGKSMVHLEVTSEDSSSPVFDATMVLKRQPLNQTNLLRVLASTPVQTLSMVIGIYWQALKLYLKGSPLYSHPAKRDTELKVPR
jgi:DUF1365 family protein